MLGELKMAEVHEASRQRDVAIAGTFKYEGKDYSVVQVIMAGQDANDTSINIGDPIYKKAWQKLNTVGNLSWTGTGEFVDIDTGETPLPIGEYSGKYGIDKAFSTITQLREILTHVAKLDVPGVKYLAEDFYTLADFESGKYSREDAAISLGIGKDASEEQIDSALQSHLEEAVQQLYKLAAVKGMRSADDDGVSTNIIRPLTTMEYVPVGDRKYETGVGAFGKGTKTRNTDSAIFSAMEKMRVRAAENELNGVTNDRYGISALTTEEKGFFKRQQKVHTSLPGPELLEVTNRIKKLLPDLSKDSAMKEEYAQGIACPHQLEGIEILFVTDLGLSSLLAEKSEA